MATEAQRKARDKYNAKTKRLSIRFRPDEEDLYQKIKALDNPSKIIKELLDKYYFGSEKDGGVV